MCLKLYLYELKVAPINAWGYIYMNYLLIYIVHVNID